MHELRFTAIYEKAEEGGYTGYVAELPGANTQGETIEETRENLKDAVSMLLDCYREDAEARLSQNVGATKEDLILEAA
jgi:predicted RNase H-like HicB family nuclease